MSSLNLSMMNPGSNPQVCRIKFVEICELYRNSMSVAISGTDFANRSSSFPISSSGAFSLLLAEQLQEELQVVAVVLDLSSPPKSAARSPKGGGQR